jgi:hypothetical protein
VARSDWSTCRDLIGPRVLAVATSLFDRLESKKFEKICKKSQISSPIPLYISLPGWSSLHTPFHLISLFQTRLFYSYETIDSTVGPSIYYNATLSLATRIQMDNEMTDTSMYTQLLNDLVERVWGHNNH